jgi:hypothetical protein
MIVEVQEESMEFLLRAAKRANDGARLEGGIPVSRQNRRRVDVLDL